MQQQQSKKEKSDALPAFKQTSARGERHVMTVVLEAVNPKQPRVSTVNTQHEPSVRALSAQSSVQLSPGLRTFFPYGASHLIHPLSSDGIPAP